MACPKEAAQRVNITCFGHSGLKLACAAHILRETLGTMTTNHVSMPKAILDQKTSKLFWVLEVKMRL